MLIALSLLTLYLVRLCLAAAGKTGGQIEKPRLQTDRRIVVFLYFAAALLAAGGLMAMMALPGH